MKFSTPTTLLTLALTAALHTVTTTALPQFPSNPNNPSTFNNNFRQPADSFDNQVAVRFTVPDGRTFTETLALDSYGYASLPIYNHNHDNRVIRGEVVHSPARYPGNTCYLLISGFEQQGAELEVSRAQRYQQVPFDVEREYGARGLYYVGAIVYCASRY